MASMTLEEAERIGAYCGRCKHWRFYDEVETAELSNPEYADRKGLTREDVANLDIGMPPCILGFCEKHKKSNFADEMYAGSTGAPDPYECFDWERWRADNENA